MAFTRPKASQINFDTTNITDSLIRINSAETGNNTNDLGIVFERGNHTNAAIVWDESADTFRLISTTHDASTTTSDINISAHHNLHVGGLETSGAIAMGTNKITGMGDPTSAQDAATKAYVDSQSSGGGAGYFKGENGTVGSSAGDIFRINEAELNTDVTIDAAENASATGPLSVASGVTLTVSGTLVII